jgi:hypothetical protein
MAKSLDTTTGGGGITMQPLVVAVAVLLLLLLRNDAAAAAAIKKSAAAEMLPPPSPRWEVVSASLEPVIGVELAAPHGILQGFETGNFMKAGDTYYYAATELGFCKNIRWDSTTRAGLWSAPNSTGPWTRLVTLRNSSSMYTVCKDKFAKDNKNTVAWATTLIFAPSGANGSQAVWNLFHHGGEAGRFQPGDGIVHSVSTTNSIEGPYVELLGTAVPGKDVVVPDSHAFAAWKLRNGSWAGFRNNVPGAPSFSVGMIYATEQNGQAVGGTWYYPGNNSVPFRYGPENPQVASSSDKSYYYSVYDALEQTPQAVPRPANQDQQRSAAGSRQPLCTDKTTCNSIGIAWSVDGVSWPASASTTLEVQLNGNHPCGQIRTALGLVAEPAICRGCYSVLWTGFSNKSSPMRGSPGFEPVCQAIIRNMNEKNPSK